ncbi:hypothetical protein [Labedaea rhizosphaerae]|uniref:Uncharacterized protein n=1 Tax=Labedaea rhizosphaerae TaxID=598644 RepID=A0A4R6SM87_LABRH|nr:hypothetical protein [Labedaea rhizosphaerae]TDQ04670.1 hypothetical protein EV186_101625 [Labedaea rhizosphaerae]
MSVEPARRTILAPYIVSWTEEVDPPARVELVPGRGIGYADEKVTDRDSHGVLWHRSAWRPYEGRPQFARIHPARQRRAMQRLLCLVCGGPADETEEGVLWLLQDHREDWKGWPNRMAVAEPPVCLPCVEVSVQKCPALRKGAVAILAGRYPVAGVRGVLYAEGPNRMPTPVEDAIVAYDSHKSRWIKAHNLVRQLGDCELFEVHELIK